MPVGNLNPVQVSLLIISRHGHINLQPAQATFVAYRVCARLQIGSDISGDVASTQRRIPAPLEEAIAAESRETLTIPPSQKRKRPSDGSRSNEDENNPGSATERPGGLKRARVSRAGGITGVDTLTNLSCPFASRNPKRYSGCHGLHLKTNGAVARHLLAHHRQAPYCPTCWDTFPSDAERDDHIRRLECLLTEPIPIEGLTLRQAQRLERFVGDTSTSGRKWKQISRLVFPRLKSCRTRCRRGFSIIPPASPTPDNIKRRPRVKP